MEENEITEEDAQAIRDKIAAEEFENETPEPVVEPKEEQEPIAEEKEEEPEIEEDPWAGVSPALRKTFEEMSDKVKTFDDVTGRLKQAENRIGSLQNKIRDDERAVQEAAKVAPAPTREEIEAAAAEDKSWQELKDEFPEWAEAMDVRLARQDTSLEKQRAEMRDLFADSKTELTQDTETRIAALQKTMAETIEMTVLSARYPNYEKDIQTKEYRDFIEAAPDDIKQKTTSRLAKDAISVLDAFHKIKSAPVAKADRKKRLEESVEVRGRKPAPTKAEADMNYEELRSKYAEEVWSE